MPVISSVRTPTRVLLLAAAAVLAMATWGPAPAHALNFSGPATFSAGNSPVSVAVGDFNGDFDSDLVVTNEFSNDVSVLLGGLGSTFTGPTNYAVGTGPQDVAIGDFNGDADPDLAVVNEFTYNVSVLTGDVGGSFTAAGAFPVGTRPLSIAAGDFNGDSDPDLVVVNESTNNVSILVGEAGASFSAPTNLAVGMTPQSVAIADFNGDSDQDLAVANGASSTISVLLGGAATSFGAPANYLPGTLPTSIAVGDFNGDSDPDLVVANDLSNNLSVLLGGAGGSFSAPTNFPVGVAPVSVTVGEFNGDSDPDLAVGNELSHNISVLLGRPGGDFSPQTNFVAGNSPVGIAAGTFDADSRSDLAVANQGSGQVSILTWAPDTVVPETTIDSGPAPLTNDATPTFTFSSNEAVSTFQCRVDSGAFAPCSSPHTTATLSEGAHTFQVRAVDDGPNTDGSPAALTFTIDSLAPAAPTLGSSAPASPANDNNPKLIGTAEAGSIVTLYSAATSADCIPTNALASGTAADFDSPGIAIPVADNTTTTLRATATDQIGNVSACSGSITYEEDSLSPQAPTLGSTNPASPVNDNNPKLIGTAEAGSTVTIYGADCAPGNALASGTAASFASPGITIPVADNSTTILRAAASDGAGNVSDCSAPITYVEDSVAQEPSITATTPASPANDNDPELIGTAEAASTVTLYRAATSADCTPANLTASGAAASFASPGITVAVADGSTTTFRAKATDQAGNVSGCSAPIAYEEDSLAPSAPTLSSSAPASPANDNNPKLIGTAEAGSIVTLYSAATSADCIPANALASGTAASFASLGIAVPVADNSTTTFRVTATDLAGNVSGCSAGSLSYEEVSPPDSGPPPAGGGPSPGGGTGGGSGGGGSGGGPSPAPDVSAPAMNVAVKALKLTSNGVVSVPLSCPASEQGGCQGTLSLQAAVGRASHRRSVRLGKVSFRIAGGKTATVKVRLSKKCQRLVKKVRRLTMVAIVYASDRAGNAKTTKKTLTLTAVGGRLKQ